VTPEALPPETDELAQASYQAQESPEAPLAYAAALDPDVVEEVTAATAAAAAAPTTVVKRPDQKIGRNEPCWCGSGKKFKFCHGRA